MAPIAPPSLDKLLAFEAKRTVKPFFSRHSGNVTLTAKSTAADRHWPFVEQIVADIHYALRSILRNPAFALTAIFTLALGIGANAAIFNLLHAVILRTLPVPNAEQLRLFSVVGPQKDAESIFSYLVFGQMQAASAGKAELAAFSAIAPMRAGEAEQVNAQLASGNFFETLRVKPEAGHLLTPSDDKLRAAYPIVLSDAYWSKRYGRDPAVLGQSINLNNTPVTIAGVAPPNFSGLIPGRRPDFWLPVSAQNDLRYKRNVWNSNADTDKPFMPQLGIRWLSVVARVYNSSAIVAINQVYARDMKREVLGWKNDPVGTRELLQSKILFDEGSKGMGDLRQQFTDPLIVLMSAGGLVLLIAAVNLASLALARVIARRKEIAVRCSIGASRGRIISQLLTEALVLSVIGGAVAIPVALAASQLLIRWASDKTPLPLDIGLEWPLLVFVGITSIVAGLVFGLLPALEAINFPLADVMKTHASAVKGMRLPWGRTLIVIQVMFSFALLTGAVLFVRTFMNYSNIDPGFAPQHVLSVQVDPLGAHYSTAQLLPAYNKILERVRNIPGVRSTSFAECGLAAHCQSTGGIQLQGPRIGDMNIQCNYVTSDYMSTVGLRMLAGRFFTRYDAGEKPLLAVLNSTAATKYFPGVNPLGQHFGDDGDRSKYEIIGIVADARVNDLHDLARPMTYYSLDQTPDYVRSLEVRAQGDPKEIEQSVRAALREAAPTLPVMEVRLLTDQVASNLLREKLVARLASAFALLALALACLGVYGVLSYAITRRMPEIGIRLALGAEGGSIRWMVLREALLVILMGLALGILVALGVTRFVRGLLYGLTPADPLSMSLSAATLLTIGLMAAFIPAWRASRVDPNTALRSE